MATDPAAYYIIAAAAIVFFASLCFIPIVANGRRKRGKRPQQYRQSCSSSLGPDTAVNTWRHSSSSQQSDIREEDIERVRRERSARQAALPVSNELPLYLDATAGPPSESLPGYESMPSHSVVLEAASPVHNLPGVPHPGPMNISNGDRDNMNRAESNAQHLSSNQRTGQAPSPPYANISVNAPQSAARIHSSTEIRSPESSQITALMQQIDSMWAAIARLRQTQVERTVASAHVPVDRSSEINSPLPEYASVDEGFVEEGRTTPRPR